jgi:hypothetical protein
LVGAEAGERNMGNAGRGVESYHIRQVFDDSRNMISGRRNNEVGTSDAKMNGRNPLPLKWQQTAGIALSL